MRRFVSILLHLGFRLLTLLAALAVLVLVIAWMSGWFRSKIPPGEREESPGSAARQWVTAEVVRFPETVEAVGTVEPQRKTAVASQILATILTVRVRASDQVTKGQLLATLDDRDVQAQRGEAEAAVAAASADLWTRQEDHKRYQMLYDNKAVTKEEYDRIKGSFEVARAQLRRARERVARTDVLLSYTKIRAPVDGLVTNRFADPGDLAVPGKPLLALHDPHHLELHASVREALAGQVRLGMKLAVHIDAVDRNLQGSVREIVPRAQEASRSVLVKVALPPDQLSGLYVGMFGRLSLPIGQTRCVVVPPEVVQRVGQLELVELIGRDGRVERRLVRTGRRCGYKVEILSGLSGGERVALPGGGSP